MARRATVVTKRKSANLLSLRDTACLLRPLVLLHLSHTLGVASHADSGGRLVSASSTCSTPTASLSTAHSMGICSSCLGGRRPSESDVCALKPATAAQTASLTFPCSSQTARTCWEISTSPTMAPPVGRTVCRSRIQKSCVASARRWSGFAPRRLSE